MILRVIGSVAGVNLLKAVCSLLVCLLAAHAVAPAQFGLVAFCMPLMSFINLVTDLGLGSAIVRHPHLDRAEAGAAMALTGLTGIAGSLALLALAFALRHVTALPGIAPLLAGFSIVTLLSAWAGAPRALLERQYAYGKIVTIEATALVAALSVFAAAMLTAPGIMALVAYYIMFQAARCAGFLLLGHRLFRLNLRLGGIAALSRIGGWVVLTNLLNYCARNLDNLLIGTFLGTQALGLYGLSYQFMTLPLVLLSWPASGVLLSTLSRVPDRKLDHAGIVCTMIGGTSAISFPLMAYMMFGARFPLEIVYGHRWQGLADVVALLAPVGAIQSIAVYNSAVLLHQGAMRRNFALALINGGTLSLVFAATVWFGLRVMLVAYLVTATAVSVVLLAATCRAAGIAPGRLLSCLVPGLLAALGGVASCWIVTGVVPHGIGQWGLCTGLYAVTVASLLAVLRRHLFGEIRALTRPIGEVVKMARV